MQAHYIVLYMFDSINNINIIILFYLKKNCTSIIILRLVWLK